ncbi:hypothetical protein [Kingella oralis]|nr:hypothetical protein [Kingella oralis]
MGIMMRQPEMGFTVAQCFRLPDGENKRCSLKPCWRFQAALMV